EDQRQRVEINIRADNMVRAANHTLEQAGEGVSTPLREGVEEGVLRVRAALASGDSQETKARTEELEAQIKPLSRATKEGALRAPSPRGGE
ncbi:MAG: hypothetical protein ACE5JL_16615, partial [Dehalococcoidia bacterium]